MKFDTSRLPRSPWVYIGALIALAMIIGLYSGAGHKNAAESPPGQTSRGAMLPADSVPVSVSKSCLSSSFVCVVWQLRITSKADSITIKNFIVDRGNCTIQTGSLPATLNFGMVLEIIVAYCDPIEVAIATDHGPITLAFDERPTSQNPVSLWKSCFGGAGTPTGCSTWQITITGRADSTTIKDVVANRGGCAPIYGGFASGYRIIYPTADRQLPYVLNFGKTLGILWPSGCNPIEVQVTTDRGSFTFTFHE